MFFWLYVWPNTLNAQCPIMVPKEMQWADFNVEWSITITSPWSSLLFFYLVEIQATSTVKRKCSSIIMLDPCTPTPSNIYSITSSDIRWTKEQLISIRYL